MGKGMVDLSSGLLALQSCSQTSACAAYLISQPPMSLHALQPMMSTLVTRKGSGSGLRFWVWGVCMGRDADLV